MKNIINVALIKEKGKERKQSTKKFITFFTIVKLVNFYFSTRFTMNIILLLTTINLPHQQI